MWHYPYVLPPSRSLARTLATLPWPSMRVVDACAEFGAHPNTMADSALKINAAIASLEAGPGIVYVPEVGDYNFDSPLEMGNGTRNRISTQNGIYIVGPTPGGMVSDSYAHTPAVEFHGRYNSSGLINVNGPMFGWGVQNIRLNGESTTPTGINVAAARSGDCVGLAFRNLRVTGTYTYSYPNAESGLSLSLNCQNNRYRDCCVTVPDIEFARAMEMDGNDTNTETNSWGNAYAGIVVEFPYALNTEHTLYGVVARRCDNESFHDLTFLNTNRTDDTGQNIPLHFDFNTEPGWPADIAVDRVDFGTSGTAVTYNGSPNSGVIVARITRISKTNGQPADPALAGLVWEP